MVSNFYAKGFQAQIAINWLCLKAALSSFIVPRAFSFIKNIPIRDKVKKGFLILCLGYYFLSFGYAFEQSNVNLTPQDYITFNNFGSGACYAMSTLELAVQYGLIQFRPHERQMSETQVRQALENLFCAESPIVISGFESLQQLSEDYDAIMKSFLKQANWDLGCRPAHVIEASLGGFFPGDEKDIARELATRLKRNESVILRVDVDGTSDGEQKLNHAVLVKGADVYNEDTIVFRIYDPNVPHEKKITYKNGVFTFEPFLYDRETVNYGQTPVSLLQINLDKFKWAREHAQRSELIERQIGSRIDGVGSIKSRGKFQGREVPYEIAFHGQTLFPVISRGYDLKRLEGKEVVFKGSLVWKNNDELLTEAGRPVYHIDTLYEKVTEKRIPTSESDRAKYFSIGTVGSRGKYWGRKGGYEIVEDGKIKYVLRSNNQEIINALAHNERQRVGIQGTIVDREGEIPVVEVTNLDDFKESFYKIIPSVTPQE